MATADSDHTGLVPDGPLGLGVSGWWSVIRRTVTEFREDNVSDWAAALTYYAVLSVFPAILAMVSVVGLIGTSATQTMIENLNAFAPGPARDVLSSWLHNLSYNQGGAGLVFVLGLGGAIWAASGYVGAFMRSPTASAFMPSPTAKLGSPKTTRTHSPSSRRPAASPTPANPHRAPRADPTDETRADALAFP